MVEFPPKYGELTPTARVWLGDLLDRAYLKGLAHGVVSTLVFLLLVSLVSIFICRYVLRRKAQSGAK